MASSQDARGPLAGRRILTTRPLAAALVQRDRFITLGADAVALPCLKLEAPEDPAAFDRIVASLADPAEPSQGVILSSRAGVEAFAESIARQGLSAATLRARTLVAVGRATATACEAAGLSPDLIPAHASSEGIVQALSEQSTLAARWVHVRARDGRETLDAAISAAGGQYELAIGYRAERPGPPPGVMDWIRQGVDAICLHSARTGQHLRELLLEGLSERAHEILARASIVSAGPVTTEALQKQGFDVAATAASPGDDGMLRAVSKLFAARDATRPS